MNLYQGGPSVELLSAGGVKPQQRFRAKLSAGVKRAYDAQVKGYIWIIEGGGSTRLTLGADAALGVVHKYLVLQLLLPPAKTFALELIVSDQGRHRRRVLLSTAFASRSCTPLHAQIPLVGALEDARERWLDWRLDVSALAKEAFGGAQTSYTLESVALGPWCKCRSIYTLRDDTSVASSVALPQSVTGIVRTFPSSVAVSGVPPEAPPTSNGILLGVFGRACVNAALPPKPPGPQLVKPVHIAFGSRFGATTAEVVPPPPAATVKVAEAAALPRKKSPKQQQQQQQQQQPEPTPWTIQEGDEDASEEEEEEEQPSVLLLPRKTEEEPRRRTTAELAKKMCTTGVSAAGSSLDAGFFTSRRNNSPPSCASPEPSPVVYGDAIAKAREGADLAESLRDSADLRLSALEEEQAAPEEEQEDDEDQDELGEKMTGSVRLGTLNKSWQSHQSSLRTPLEAPPSYSPSSYAVDESADVRLDSAQQAEEEEDEDDRSFFDPRSVARRSPATLADEVFGNNNGAPSRQQSSSKKKSPSTSTSSFGTAARFPEEKPKSQAEYDAELLWSPERRGAGASSQHRSSSSSSSRRRQGAEAESPRRSARVEEARPLSRAASSSMNSLDDIEQRSSISETAPPATKLPSRTAASPAKSLRRSTGGQLSEDRRRSSSSSARRRQDLAASASSSTSSNSRHRRSHPSTTKGFSFPRAEKRSTSSPTTEQVRSPQSKARSVVNSNPPPPSPYLRSGSTSSNSNSSIKSHASSSAEKQRLRASLSFSPVAAAAIAADNHHPTSVRKSSSSSSLKIPMMTANAERRLDDDDDDSHRRSRKQSASLNREEDDMASSRPSLVFAAPSRFQVKNESFSREEEELDDAIEQRGLLSSRSAPPPPPTVDEPMTTIPPPPGEEEAFFYEEDQLRASSFFARAGGGAEDDAIRASSSSHKDAIRASSSSSHKTNGAYSARSSGRLSEDNAIRASSSSSSHKNGTARASGRLSEGDAVRASSSSSHKNGTRSSGRLNEPRLDDDAIIRASSSSKNGTARASGRLSEPRRDDDDAVRASSRSSGRLSEPRLSSSSKNGGRHSHASWAPKKETVSASTSSLASAAVPAASPDNAMLLERKLLELARMEDSYRGEFGVLSPMTPATNLGNDTPFSTR